MTKQSTSPDAVHVRPEALRGMSRWCANPYLEEPRPALEQVRVEPDGRVISTNGHVLAVFEPATPPAEMDYPNYQKVIPTEPPLATIPMSLPYLKQALSQLWRMHTPQVVLEVWGETQPVKLTATDESGTLTLFIMPQQRIDPKRWDVSQAAMDAQADEDFPL